MNDTEKDTTAQLTAGRWLEIRGRNCLIWITPRPFYCDRGNYLAQILQDQTDEAVKALSLDEQDGWPRYYFDMERMKLEIVAWLRKRKQFVTDAFELKK